MSSKPLTSLSGFDPVQAAYMTHEHCIAVDEEDKIMHHVTKVNFTFFSLSFCEPISYMLFIF